MYTKPEIFTLTKKILFESVENIKVELLNKDVRHIDYMQLMHPVYYHKD